MSCTVNASTLAHFTGTEGYFFHPLFKGINYTDGVKYLGDNGCDWLKVMILSHLKLTPAVRGQDFVCITMTKTGRSAVVNFTDGDDKILFSEDVEYTDCTVDEIKFFFTDNVLMLSSEY
jgi:hypothetical protein